MIEMICVCESIYRGALTRGERYSVPAVDENKDLVRIRADNGRTRWFPGYCFCSGDQTVPTLRTFHLDDPISQDLPIDVTVELSTGEKRWCTFATPSALANCGNTIDGTQVRFHFNRRHFIIATALSEELVARMLKYIDSQGELQQCTLPCELIADDGEAG